MCIKARASLLILEAHSRDLFLQPFSNYYEDYAKIPFGTSHQNNTNTLDFVIYWSAVFF